MDAVLRAAVIYLFLMLVFRISGKRTLAEATPFDFVMLLIIAETTQQGLLGNDFSVTNAGLLIITLIGIDIALSYLKRAFPKIDRLTEGGSIILLKEGEPLRDRMKKARVDIENILCAARKLHGLEGVGQIKYAVLEKDGGISIVPYPQE